MPFFRILRREGLILMINKNIASASIAFMVGAVASGSPAWADHGSMGFGLGTASPIITDTAVTLPEGKFAVGLRMQYISFKRFSDNYIQSHNEAFHEAGSSRHTHSTDELLTPALVGAYGITDDITVGLRFPYVMRTNVRGSMHGGDHEVSTHDFGDINGIGDVTVWGEYRFFHTPDNLTNVAALFAVKAPTGRANRVGKQIDGFVGRELLDTHLQPGTGSWDGSLGLAFTQAFGSFSFDSSIVYTWVTEGAQNTDMGDIFNYNFALSWSPGSGEAAGLQASSNINPWTFIMEFNGEWRDAEVRHNWGGSEEVYETSPWTDPDSGSHILYFSPGVRFAPGSNWNVGLSFGAPIVSDQNGHQVDPDYRIIGRINMTF